MNHLKEFNSSLPLFKKLLYLFICISYSTYATNEACLPASVKVQVLGSGGPELIVDRASSSYLIWLNDKAIIMIDAGGGSSMRFAQSKANWEDLQILLFSHFHADHSSDFATLVKASWFGNRQLDLPVFGPFANGFMPSTTTFIKALFGVNDGAYKYLSDFYNNNDEIADYRLIPHNIKNTHETQLIFKNKEATIYAQQVKHGPIPAFTYIIKVCDKAIVISGDTNGEGIENIELENTDLFIAHHAIPESAGKVAKSLHMTPMQIGKIATHLNTRKLVLSHRMNRSLGKEKQSEQYIKQNYKGKIIFANDLDTFILDR